MSVFIRPHRRYSSVVVDLSVVVNTCYIFGGMEIRKVSNSTDFEIVSVIYRNLVIM